MPNRSSRPSWIGVGTLAIGCLIWGLLGALPAAHAAADSTATGTAGTAAAKAHFKAGTTYYDLGKYDEAIREFEAAYEAKIDPAFLFNLAQANRLGGHPAEALHFYRTYLRYVPNPPNLADIEANVRALERAVAEKPATGETPEGPPRSGSEGSLSPPSPPASSAAATTPTPTPAPPAGAPPVLPSAEPPRPTASEVTASGPGPAATASSNASAPPAPTGLSSRRNIGKVLGVVGVAVLGTGVGFGLAAGAQSRKVESATTFDPAVEKTGKNFDTLKWVGVVVGAVTAAAGAVLYLTAGQTPKSSAESTPRTAFLPLAGSHFGGAVLQVSFR